MQYDYLTAIKADPIKLQVGTYNAMPANCRKYHLGRYFVYMPASGWRPVEFVKGK